MTEKSGYIAKSKHLLISPFKLRRVANVIRDRSYSDAMAILENLPHKGARFLKKTLISAAGNAMFLNKDLDEERLYIKELQVNEGPRMRRVWIRGRGRRDLLLKRMSHISIVVDEKANKGGRKGGAKS